MDASGRFGIDDRCNYFESYMPTTQAPRPDPQCVIPTIHVHVCSGACIPTNGTGQLQDPDSCVNVEHCEHVTGTSGVSNRPCASGIVICIDRECVHTIASDPAVRL